jgi:O-antigen/teichoic acid export membrane protein
MKKYFKKKYSLHKETIDNFFWRGLELFGKQGFSFFSFLIFVKILTPFDYGIYGYIMASVMFLSMFADFGIASATSKYVAEYNATDKNKLKSVLFNSTLVIFIFTVIVTLVTVFFGKYFLDQHFNYLLYALPILFLSPMTSLYSGVYMGLKKFKKLALISLIVGAVSLVLNYVMIKTYGLIGAMIAQNVFYALLLAALALGHREFHVKTDKSVIKQILGYSLILGLSTVAYYLYNRVDVIILGKFGYIQEIAYFNVLNKIFEVLLLPFLIYGQISAPNITANYVKKKYALVRRDFLRHTVFLLILGIIITSAVFFIVPILIKMFLSNYFTSATEYMFNVLIVLLPIRILAAYMGAAHTISTGNAHYGLWTLAIAGIANVILDIVFIMKFGFIGVVYSTVICYSFAIISSTLLYHFKLKRLIREKDVHAHNE